MNIFIFAVLKRRKEAQMSGQMALARRMFVNIFRLPFLESGRVCECASVKLKFQNKKKYGVWRSR